MRGNFRVWDKEYRNWDEPNKKGGYVQEYRDFVITHEGGLKIYYYGYEEGFFYANPDRYIVEFSTGLKDKNGKEIYEGDIVNIFFRLDDYEYNYEVGEINLLSDDLWYSDQNEVVGNIHDLDLTEVE